MYLFDTDIVIWILRGDNQVSRLIKTFIKDDMAAVSTLTIAEVYQHIFPREIPVAEKLFSIHTLYPVNATIARSGGLYWQEYHKKFEKLSLVDCLIAATAKEHHLTLLTLNTRHFPMSDIQKLDPHKNKKG